MSVRPLPDLVLADLECLIGSDFVAETPEFRVGGVRPAAEVVVNDVEGLVEVLKVAGEHGLHVCPAGGGTKLGWGAPPRACDLLVRTTRAHLGHRGAEDDGGSSGVYPALPPGPLAAITEYDPDNLTVTAGAGASVAAVQAFVAQDGLVLPLDPPDPGAATIGGVLSTNDHGPHRLSRGGNRDVVLGLSAVLAGGERVKAGGRTIKNVTGYDLTRLFVGSLGALGVLAEATIRLLPSPPCEGVVVVPQPDLESAAGLVSRFRASQLLPAALEVLSPASSDLVEEEVVGLIGAGGYVVVVAFEGQETAVERQVRDTLALAGRIAGVVLTEPRPIKTLWSALSGQRSAARRVGYPLEAKLSVPPARLWEVLTLLEKTAASEVMWTASAGVGTAQVWLGSPEKLGASPVGFVPTLVEARAAADGSGGSLILTDGSQFLAPDFDAWGPDPGGLAVMRGLKSKFDPRGCLNPGRVAGGI